MSLNNYDNVRQYLQRHSEQEQTSILLSASLRLLADMGNRRPEANQMETENEENEELMVLPSPKSKQTHVNERKKMVRHWVHLALGVQATRPCRDWPTPNAADHRLVCEGIEEDNIAFIFPPSISTPTVTSTIVSSDLGTLPPSSGPTTEAPTGKRLVCLTVDWETRKPLVSLWTVKAANAIVDMIWVKHRTNQAPMVLPQDADPERQMRLQKDILFEDVLTFIKSKKEDRQRSNVYIQSKNQRNRRAGRRQSALTFRLSVAEALGLPRKLVKELTRIGKETMSDDESEDGRDGYHILSCPSRHPIITEFLRALDTYAHQAKAKGHRLLRIRRFGNTNTQERSLRELPAGLPENTYCPTWMNGRGKLSAHKIRKAYKGRSVDLSVFQQATKTLTEGVAALRATESLAPMDPAVAQTQSGGAGAMEQDDAGV